MASSPCKRRMSECGQRSERTLCMIGRKCRRCICRCKLPFDLVYFDHLSPLLHLHLSCSLRSKVLFLSRLSYLCQVELSFETLSIRYNSTWTIASGVRVMSRKSRAWISTISCARSVLPTTVRNLVFQFELYQTSDMSSAGPLPTWLG